MNKEKKDKKIEDLDPHQYEDIFFEEDIPLENSRNDVNRIWLYFGTFILIFFLLLGSRVKIPQQLEFKFFIKDKNNCEQILTFDQNVFVDSLQLNVGDSVFKGTPIATISGFQLNQLLVDYNAILLEEKLLNQQGKQIYIEQKKQKDLENTVLYNEVCALKAGVQKLQSIKNREETILKLEIEMAHKNYYRDSVLYGIDALSAKEFDKTRQIYRKAILNNSVQLEKYQRQLSTLEVQIINLNKQRQRVESQIIELKLTMDKGKSVLVNKKKKILNMIHKFYGRSHIRNDKLAIEAETTGIVSYVSQDKIISKNHPLIKIYVRTPVFIATGSIPPKFIGRVNENKEVKLKISSFPHFDWGKLSGRLANISLTPNAEGNYPFEVDITDYGKLEKLLYKGMEGSMSVVIEEKTFFSHIFNKLQEGYYYLQEQ
ncbi:HlyD family secretion protein [Reichenbachiella faecimaris]|uniref:HlyD family secretion protein n=1 Tax=Reichenbachiella faecimaris TaxID=692418 RepID=A0A1W2GHS2_REIFA|nr:HlyD family efflux transporter periplasmic adaptor subunit [Reichenbachiella faecimaris]SMD36032.1 HlyD family secretion protein [Reichenbachiella faecimaris]